MRINGAAYVVEISRSQPPAAQSAVTEAGEVALTRGVAALDGGNKDAGRGRSIDRVEISPNHTELERLKRDLAALPDLRLDRVALAKQSLQDGVYRLASGVLAQKMMEAYATY